MLSSSRRGFCGDGIVCER
uniref:Uncharacterized protein n=1 Tax=Arundo donax TaxID=35708 RepID=A0A0A8ZGW1_ARUDO